VTAAATYNKGEQVNSPALLGNNPALLANPASAAEFGKPLIGSRTRSAQSAARPPTRRCSRATYARATMVVQSIQYVRASRRNLHDQLLYADGKTIHPCPRVGPSIRRCLRFENPAYGLVTQSVGVAKDQWTAQLFAENLADRNVSMFTSSSQFIVAQTPNRPRVLGLQVGYKF